MIQLLKSIFSGANTLNSTKIAENYYVAAQIELSDIPAIAEQGFQVIVCNRPDGEQNQPISTDIAAACKANGLEFHYLPMAGPNFSESDVTTVKALTAANKKVLAYCRSGNRSSILFNGAQG